MPLFTQGNIMRIWLYIILLLVSPQTYAVLFTPPPTDKSIELLGVIFGDSIGSIFLGGNANPVLQSLMEHFNLIIVTMGLLVLSYVSIMSTINTAQEGSAMGKKWSALWAPMRSIIGMALMVPGPTTGYSTIQVTVMWVILQGIGIADQIWDIALEGLSQGSVPVAGTATQDPELADIKSDANTLALKMLDIAVCMETFKQLAKDPSHNINNDWLKANANQIKDFSKNLTSPTASDLNDHIETPESTADNRKYYTTKISHADGYLYYGVDDGIEADQSACGKIYVSGTATVIDDPTNASTNNGNYDFTTYSSDQDLNDAAAMLYEFKKQALSSMLVILKPLAQAIVSDTTKYSSPSVFNPETSVPYPKGYASSAIDAYTSTMSGLQVPNSAPLDAAMIEAQQIGMQSGWITAGTYYFVLNKTLSGGRLFKDRTAAPTASNIFECTGTCISNGFNNTSALSSNDTNRLNLYSITSGSDLNFFTRNLAYGNKYFSLDQSSTHLTSLGFDSSLAGGDAAAGLVAIGTGIIGPIMSDFEAMLNVPTGTDPLLAFSIFGRNMMIACEFAWMALIVMSLIMATPVFAPFGIGEGPGATLFALLLTVISVILTLVGVLWSIGASLAIYMPLIPYMMFTLAALGWLLLVVESIIAAPIIALGLVIPAGDELGKVESALGILANVFMRPTLMIFGFVLAGRVYAAVVTLINFGMLDVFKTINVNTNFSSVVILFVYASFLISVTNTCFSLIYVLPDKILRWIGGPHEQTDVSALQQVKGASQQASKEVGGGMGESGKKSTGLAQRKAKEAGEKGNTPTPKPGPK